MRQRISHAPELSQSVASARKTVYLAFRSISLNDKHAAENSPTYGAALTSVGCASKVTQYVLDAM